MESVMGTGAGKTGCSQVTAYGLDPRAFDSQWGFLSAGVTRPCSSSKKGERET